jgi:uncharacterized protein DUF998
VQAPAEYARPLAIAGLCAAATGAVLVAALHVVPPTSDVNAVRRTISEYALLETGWVFDVAVLAVSAGSIAALVALIWTRLTAATSGSSVALLLWSAGLAGVSLFPKHNWSVGPSLHGDVHRVAGVVAFLSLPVAAVLLGRAWLRHPRWAGFARWSLSLGLLSLLCFSPIALAVALEPITGVRWWRAIPLGSVERALASVEVLTVLVLAWWAARATPRDVGVSEVTVCHPTRPAQSGGGSQPVVPDVGLPQGIRSD